MAAYFIWGLVDTAITFSAQGPMEPSFVLMALGLMGALSLFSFLALRRRLAVLRPRHPRSLIAMGVCYTSLNYLNIIALKHLTLTMFYVIVFDDAVHHRPSVACVEARKHDRQKGFMSSRRLFGSRFGVGA
ncbi:MAG: hypothetical protein PHS57_05125 [Alphaproteobacteria bacterium]|nr:hypothetical protein [Alphaproteobacteria bacterium]